MAGRVLDHQRRGIGTGEDEQFYRNLFDAAPCALLSIGTNGRILSANRRAVQFFGCRPDEIIGRSVLDLFSPGSAGTALACEVFQRLCIGDEIPGRELEMQRATGTLVWVRLFAQPIRDMEGRFVASCSMVQEISAPQQAGRRLPDQGKEICNSLIGSLDDGRMEKHIARLLVKSADCACLLGVNEIDWFGAAGNYVEVHVGSRSYLLRRTMKEVEGLLDPSRFHRIHRSSIVNTRRIKELRMRSWGDYDVILHDGVRLTLSRAYRKKLLRFLTNDLRLCPLATSPVGPPLKSDYNRVGSDSTLRSRREVSHVICRQSVGSGG